MEFKQLLNLILTSLLHHVIFFRRQTYALNYNLEYNTTSGVYAATLVEVNALLNSSEKSYVAKLAYVPYAEKPERFKQAVLKKYTHGVHRTPKPVICFQSTQMSAYGLFHIDKPIDMSEDCLMITLYMPLAAPGQPELNNLSTVIHIHGGSNFVGGSNLFDGSILASHGNLIVAIINYRLGVFGFLSDGTKKFSGNYGLKDQILAIKWLKQNCDVLRCNPNSITLWGHSAGAGDVNWLAISPYSNHLFQRAIIQSGSAFSYWGLDKLHKKRYKSLRNYFNCTLLPDEHTRDNGAMTRLIEECLLKIEIKDLYLYNFALIDLPGPVNDEFLGNESLINAKSPKEMIQKQGNKLKVDVLVGINGVEGFAFESHFSSSVKFWTQKKLTTEVMLTLERHSLLLRERCMQNSFIINRLKLEEFYKQRVRKIIDKESDLKEEKIRRMKAMFVNSDAIFDAGFVGFVNLFENVSHERRSDEAPKSLFVYEYLHENSAIQPMLRPFKKYLNKNFVFSTHFDGIDLAFGTFS